jgi:uncharacterized membrane protein YfcA
VQPLSIIAIVCAAGFVQGSTGFGFALTSMPLLPLMMGYKDAAALVFLLSAIVIALTFFRNRKHYNWREGWELIAGAVVGIPIGFYLFIHAEESLLRHLLGAVLCAFAINEFLIQRWMTRAADVTSRLGFPLGMLSGSLDAAFNMAGPPAVAYVYARPWSAQQIAASLQVQFGIGLILRTILSAGTGFLNARVLQLSACAALPLSASILLATHVAPRIPRVALRRVVFLLLGVMGLKYLFLG